MTWEAEYPPAVKLWVGNKTDAGMHKPIGFIPHVQVGNGSLGKYFNVRNNQVSSHLWLSKTGNFEQYVPFTKIAWAQIAGNPYWISCECEGYPTEDYTPIQLQRLAEFYSWGMEKFGWPLRITDDPLIGGLGTHRMGGTGWGGHTCPGPLRANRRTDIINLVQANSSGVKEETMDPDEIAAAVWNYPRPDGMTPPINPPAPGHMQQVVGHTYNVHHRIDDLEKELGELSTKLDSIVAMLDKINRTQLGLEP